MLNLWGNDQRHDCEGNSRREFLKVGALGMTGFGLSDLLRAKAAAAAAGQKTKDTSVIWIWLGGGPSHIETFDPKMEAPAEFRSVVGAIDTKLSGVQIGGMLPEMAKRLDRWSLVRSFAHGNSGHGGGTHWVMTGYNHVLADAGMPPKHPSFGSVASRMRGANDPTTGMPTYVRINGLYADGPDWLGPSYGPFDVGGQAQRNMNTAVAFNRIDDRRHLLDALDRVDRQIDRGGLMKGLDDFENQAFGLIMGRSKEAFDLDKEEPRLRDRYKEEVGHQLGQQLLMARRLCEAGCGFVTMNYQNSFQGWDMHSTIKPQIEQACPPLDRALGLLLDDIESRGLSEKILVVVTGEFGRTPRINGGAGRDHWGPLCTLAMAGGGLKMGQIVGESSSKAEVPKSTPIEPKHLMSTIFHVLGIDRQAQLPDPAGRPTYLLPDAAEPIRELI
ncbi:MAG: DUF1501 domain-containing protein [Pirellulales bacterium]